MASQRLGTCSRQELVQGAQILWRQLDSCGFCARPELAFRMQKTRI